ncbi:unnamed protein product [Schistosoma margrebowiei]|uniref:Uncharacterized protein n=1 Tax=Schistosoma margrebowiei TaxID=48269 RepID=A0A183MPQ1_9TREM|nr:unnamed protein product [Schistosoma margrebowiei]
MVVRGSQQETLDPSFVLFGTRQWGAPVILRELLLPGGSDPIRYWYKEALNTYAPHKSHLICVGAVIMRGCPD